MKTLFSLFLVFSFYTTFSQTFTWNALGTGSATTFPRTYNTTVSGITMNVNFTANKNGGQGAVSYGNATRIGGSGVCGGTPNGLFMEMSGGGSNWLNSITVDISFSVPVTGPVTFTAYDINEAIWGGGGPDSYYCDRLTVSATSDGTTAIAGSAITVGGCTGTTNTSGATSTFIESNNGTNGCLCALKNISVGANCSQKVQTIRLVYSNGVPTYAKYGISQYQNIVISSISANNAANPVITANPSPASICSGESSTLTSSCSSNCTGITYAWVGGTTPTTGNSVSASPTSTSNYTVTATNSSGCSISQLLTVTVTCTLAVSLSNFEIYCTEEGKQVYWATTSEENNDYFILQGSGDGISFIDLEQIRGAGNSQSKLTYHVNAGLDNNSYYRLKQVDFDGTQNYSEMIHANCNESESIVFPNPFDKNLIVKLNEFYSENLAISIKDMNGKIMKQFDFMDHTSKADVVLNLEELKGGIYMMEIIDLNTQTLLKKSKLCKM